MAAGDRFGRLTAIEEITGFKRQKWLCICDCGECTVIAANRLVGGLTVSCGCRKKEIAQRTIVRARGVKKRRQKERALGLIPQQEPEPPPRKRATKPNYLPSRKQIARVCREIREEWDEREYFVRAGKLVPPRLATREDKAHRRVKVHEAPRAAFSGINLS